MNKFVSNVIELFTPYRLSEAADPLAIAEKESGAAICARKDWGQ